MDSTAITQENSEFREAMSAKRLDGYLCLELAKEAVA